MKVNISDLALKFVNISIKNEEVDISVREDIQNALIEKARTKKETKEQFNNSKEEKRARSFDDTDLEGLFDDDEF